MTRADIYLPGTPKSAGAMKECQGKACNGAERVPEGGVQLNPTKWVCATCYSVIARRMQR